MSTRCYICDTPLEKPTVGSDNKTNPCNTCIDIISEAVSEGFVTYIPEDMWQDQDNKYVQPNDDSDRGITLGFTTY